MNFLLLKKLVGSALSVAAILMMSIVTNISAATTDTSKLPQVSEISENLGVQVRRAMIMRSDVGKDKSGRDVLYTVVLGAPARLGIVDVNSGDLVTSHSLPGTSGAWAVKVSPDNTVYLGAYNEGYIFRYFPKTDELKNLGRPFKTHDAVIYPMDAMPDGKIYGGSYPSGHAYEYDPQTEKFRDLGDMTTTTEQERWIRVTVADPVHKKLYFGIGNKPQLAEYDLTTGKKRELLTPEFANITAVYDMNLEGGRLFCRKETHNPFEYFVLDVATGKPVMIHNADTGETTSTFINISRGMSPKSPVANKLYFGGIDKMLHEYDLDTNTVKSLGAEVGQALTGYAYVKLDDPEWPGYTLTGTIGNGARMYRYNLETGKAAIMPIDLPAEAVNIHDLETGPDGKIYMGGYLAGNAAVYDPATGKSVGYSGTGQPESLTFVGDKLYMGIYPNARIFEWDTSAQWGENADGKSNPQHLFDLTYNKEIPGYTDQDRPFGMVGADDLQKVFIGTVPKNGRFGGAFAIYDTKTGGDPEVYWNIIPDQSIVSLEYKDGLVYGGSSIYGGLGAKPKAKEGRLFIWDPAQKKIVFETVPVPGKGAINVLYAAPDGNIWGVASGTIFVFDPAQRKVVYSANLVSGVNSHFRDASLLTGEDGQIYGTTGDILFRINPKTKATELIARGANKIARDRAGNIYITGTPRAMLMKWKP